MSLRIYRPFSAPIRVLSFDLDDTLYDNVPVIKKTIQAYYDKIWELVPEAKVQGEVFWLNLRKQVIVDQPELFHDVTQWRIEVLTRGFKQLGLSGDRLTSSVDDVFQAFVTARSDFEVPQQTFDVLDKLRQKYPLVAATNGNVDINAIGLAPYFVGYYRAGEQNMRSKPYPEMLHLIAKQLDVPVSSILHIGDNVTTDVQVAHNAGAQSLWFNPEQKKYPSGYVLPNAEYSDLEDLLEL